MTKKFKTYLPLIKFTISLPIGLLLLSPLTQKLDLSCQATVQAATVSSGTLSPGQTVADTQNHGYNTNDFITQSNWTLGGSDPASVATWQTVKPAPAPTTQISLNTQSGGSRTSTAVFNYTFDMSKAVDFTGWLWSNYDSTFLLANTRGDSLGFVLTPVTPSKVATGGVGPGLGITGLPNTIFMGRDLYYNSPDGDANIGVSNGVYGSIADQVEIRLTDSAGKLLANAPNSVYQGSPAWSFGESQGGESVHMNWVPSGSPTSSGTVTGTLSYTQGGVTIKQTLSMQTSMSLGIVDAVGGNYGQKMAGLSALTAYKGTAPVEVHYINSTTGKAIPNQNFSTINSNVNDLIGVISPGGTPVAADNYDYIAPLIPGYTLNAASLPVSHKVTALTYNLDGTTTNTNIMNVSYTPNPQTASFDFSYITGALHTPVVPSSLTTNGVTDGLLPSTINATLTAKVPSGYYISSITGPDGIIHTGTDTVSTLSNANLSQATFSGTNNNKYSIVLSPSLQTASFTFAYDPSTSVGTPNPTLPTIKVESGVTGSLIDNPSAQVAASIPTGYKIKSVTSPEGNVYPDLNQALAAHPNYTPTNNNFVLTLEKITHIVTSDKTITRTIQYVDANDSSIIVRDNIIQKVIFHNYAVLDAGGAILGYDTNGDGKVDTADVTNSWIADSTTGDSFSAVQSPILPDYGTPSIKEVPVKTVVSTDNNQVIKVSYPYTKIVLPFTGGYGLKAILAISTLFLLLGLLLKIRKRRN